MTIKRTTAVQAFTQFYHIILAAPQPLIARHASELPQISLDAIREETGAEPTGNQGAVVQAAREQARVLLRSGDDFVWNATNLSREIRGQVVDLLTAYDARFKIVYVEASRDLFYAQNRDRNAVLPRAAIERLMDPVGSARSN